MNPQEIEQRVHRRMAWIQSRPGKINDMLQAELLKVEQEPYRLWMRFPAQAWQMNPMEILHGGMMATMLDTAMGMLIHCLLPESICPTVSMNLQYSVAVHEGEEIVVEAVLESQSKSFAHLSARARNSNEQVLATASAVFAPRPKQRFQGIPDLEEMIEEL